MANVLITITLLTGLLASGAASAQCSPTAASSLQTVGSTRLSVWFWDVYDAELLTDSGNYKDYDRRALRLSYLREIEAADLVDTTKEEWQRLGIEITPTHQQWLAKLNRIWPDVQAGDCLMLVENAQGQSQFFNTDKELGTIESSEFTDDFLAIWLSPDSRFKEERNELIGADQ
ncbi:chalcone isomerase family protein [Pseudidiomarina sp. 1APP75-32.1]|uniref:Chalcone isomerase family protein n=1 Tax=Pseudidiomarina terrestris TaxID=2820060 RepID=A0AAW7R074_9GAMM|nr:MULTISPECIES: chalcone isomerase family protein [unclassified Pseudidiomarina]MDN7124201.1 chalcone isomerase family protein [Pseudidiomarina sp. 1APP75-32.1]MEA3586936.1 chalcone isomerase family protein [Pseudidiomarina sp. 1APP75-27a]